MTEKQKQFQTYTDLILFHILKCFPLRISAIILNKLTEVKMPAGVAPIGLFWKHRGRRSCTRAHTHIWLISSKLKHFVRGVHSRYTHARTRRLNLGLERDTYSEVGYISPFSISSLSNYILVSSKKWRRAASRQLPGNLHGYTGTSSKDWRYEKLLLFHPYCEFVCMSSVARYIFLYFQTWFCFIVLQTSTVYPLLGQKNPIFLYARNIPTLH